jgi:hypothetical protein
MPERYHEEPREKARNGAFEADGVPWVLKGLAKARALGKNSAARAAR